MPKALIISELDSTNLGDQAIFAGLCELLRARQFTIAGLGLESTRWYEWNDHAAAATGLHASTSPPLRQRIGRLLPRPLLEIARLLYLPLWYLHLRARAQRLGPRLATVDITVIGGGGLFINNKLHFALAVRRLCRTLRARGIPYGFSGVGASEQLDRATIRLFAPAVAGASFVHARDSRASELISRYFGLAAVPVGPDYALFCPAEVAPCRTTPADRPHIGINVMAPSAVHYPPAEYEAALRLLHDFVVANARSCHFAIFTTGYHEDRQAAREVARHLPGGIPQPEIRDDFATPAELLRFVAQLDGAVTMRLHASLFAALANVPFIALAPDNKVSACLAGLGLKRLTQSPSMFSIAGLNVLITDPTAYRPDLDDVLRKQRTAVEPLIADIIAAVDRRKTAGRIAILGTRGIPARHGGFETFAERLALYLVGRGWEVTVYCQENARRYRGPRASEWSGIRRVHVPVTLPGAIGTIAFDWKATWHASRQGIPVLTLGYNTAVFNALFRLTRTPNLINMDGIEWRRDKWGPLARLWLRFNEHMACRLADHLIADNPAIVDHLRAYRLPKDRIAMMPYGADAIDAADVEPLASLGLEPQGYTLIIARPEPDNSILEIVQAYCARPRGRKLVVLGTFHPQSDKYHREIVDAANAEVIFPGAIYDKKTVASLRFHALLYIHGHKVGGTNPSLVEALGAGTPVLAHDNPFNRWVAEDAARYFINSARLDALLTELLDDTVTLHAMSRSARRRHNNQFQWHDVLHQYEMLLSACFARTHTAPPVPSE